MDESTEPEFVTHNHTLRKGQSRNVERLSRGRECRQSSLRSPFVVCTARRLSFGRGCRAVSWNLSLNNTTRIHTSCKHLFICFSHDPIPVHSTSQQSRQHDRQTQPSPAIRARQRESKHTHLNHFDRFNSTNNKTPINNSQPTPSHPSHPCIPDPVRAVQWYPPIQFPNPSIVASPATSNPKGRM